MDKTLNKWCEKLLDTGKGNQLINFKETKLKTIKILSPEVEKVFDMVSSGKKVVFYEVDDYIRRLNDNEIEEESSDEENGKGGKFDKITERQIVQALSSQLKPHQVLSFKKGFTLQKILTNIKKTAENSLTEKGINILYIAFGFLKWKEKEESGIEFRSPLLLIPITLINDSTNLPFEMIEYEDEISINSTLSYKLKNDFGIEIPELKEDEGFDEYLDSVSKVVEKQGWKVEKSAYIGTFSFLKLNMYMDLKENESKIMSNQIVRKLLNLSGKDVSRVEDYDIDEQFKRGAEVKLHNVVDADSSQMAAIIKAKSGKNIVLQGPPGTGKSQTITNLIAEFLYDGKKILFVSEKLAALNVVYNNLKKAGLADFCLELHSNKSNKKDVTDELYRVLNKGQKTVKESANAEYEELLKSKEKLDNYAETMHTLQPCINKTPFQILGMISKFNKAPTFEYVIKSIETKDSENLKKVCEELDVYIKFASIVGYDYHKAAWYGYKNHDFSYQAKLELKNNLKKILEYLQDIEKYSKDFSKKLGINILDHTTLLNLVPQFKAISELNYFDNNIFEIDKLNEICISLDEYLKAKNSLLDKKAIVSSIFEEELFENDLQKYYLKFKNDYVSKFRVFNGNYRRDKKALQQYQIDKKKKLSYEQLVDLLKKAKAIKQEEDSVAQKFSKLNSLFATDLQADLDLNILKCQLFNLREVMTEEFPTLSQITKKDFEKLQEGMKNFLAWADDNENGYSLLLELQDNFEKTVCNLESMELSNLIKKIKLLQSEFESLDNWLKLSEVLEKLKALDVLEFVDKSIENKIDQRTLKETYQLMFYTQWMYYILNKNNILHNFSRLTQDAAVEKFKQKDKLRFEISKAEINAKLSSTMPNPSNMASGSQMNILVREANKKRKLRPVRLLLRDIGQLIQTLKPCFLMSPLSVSTYLDSETCQFDVVIFDEASQIFPWDAIGAIYRGKQLIVVGDSKQMPPSNFFNADVDDEDDDENYEDDSLDFESILDLCSASFEQYRLNWHYRSRTEELISFSNMNFYDGTLTTFPSTHKHATDLGVDFYYVPDGIFDRKSKCNMIEAEKVADLVFEHFQSHPERSLGVVAFSIHQQEAIEEIIQKRRAENDKFAQFFDSKRKEPFFVKNLETVQGDERDTIIFSVAYAKDSLGKFLHNFGPLNRKGGERRLNVAITRAKYNVKLVSSIKSYDIDLTKTSALGAKLLKDYLDCAEHGMININKNMVVDNNAEPDSYFEVEVYDVLKEAGFEVDMQVGCSGYRIDLAIKHPEYKSDYVLAVECDGASYHSGKTTRDRDRLRQEVLEKLGWKFYRIWSTDWFTNKQVEKKKLIDAANKAIRDFNAQEDIEKSRVEDQKVDNQNQTSTEDNEPTFIVTEEIKQQDLTTKFKEYEIYDIYSKRLPSFDNSIYDIVETEAPITQELLFKRVLPFFDQQKVTDAYRREVLMKLRYTGAQIFKVKDYFVVDKDMKIEMRIPKKGDEPRDILMIADDELASGMLEIVKTNIAISKEGLFSTMTNLLGFKRQGNNINIKLERVLKQLINDNKVKLENSEIVLC